MTDFSDPSFSLMVGIVAAVLAACALWRQKGDRSFSVTTQNLVKTSIASQEEHQRQIELEWKVLRRVAQLALILTVVIVGVVLFALLLRPTGKRIEDPSSSLVST